MASSKRCLGVSPEFMCCAQTPLNYSLSEHFIPVRGPIAGGRAESTLDWSTAFSRSLQLYNGLKKKRDRINKDLDFTFLQFPVPVLMLGSYAVVGKTPRLKDQGL